MWLSSGPAASIPWFAKATSALASGASSGGSIASRNSARMDPPEGSIARSCVVGVCGRGEGGEGEGCEWEGREEEGGCVCGEGDAMLPLARPCNTLSSSRYGCLDISQALCSWQRIKQ